MFGVRPWSRGICLASICWRIRGTPNSVAVRNVRWPVLQCELISGLFSTCYQALSVEKYGNNGEHVRRRFAKIKNWNYETHQTILRACKSTTSTSSLVGYLKSPAPQLHSPMPKVSPHAILDHRSASQPQTLTFALLLPDPYMQVSCNLLATSFSPLVHATSLYRLHGYADFHIQTSGSDKAYAFLHTATDLLPLAPFVVAWAIWPISAILYIS